MDSEKCVRVIARVCMPAPDTELAKIPPGIWSLVMVELMKDEGLPAQIAATLKANLSAKRSIFDRATKTWESEPDARAQLDAIKLLLAYSEGMPLQRVLEHHINETRRSLTDELRDSPALLEAMKAEIEKAEFRTRKQRRAQAVEIEVPAES